MNEVKKIIIIVFSFCVEIVRVLESFYTVIRYYKKADNTPNLNIGSKEECVVIGNGPSIVDTFSRKKYFLDNKKKICVNDFAQSKFFKKIKPNFYIFADPAYWSSSVPKELNNTYRKNEEIFVKKVNWNMTIFLPQSASNWRFYKNLPKVNHNISIRYFQTATVECTKLLQYFLYKNNFAMVPAQNVLICAIFVCLNIGFKKIYVVGADHSWHRSIGVDSRNVLLLQDNKGTDSNNLKAVPYRINPIESKVCTMHEIFSVYAKTFKGYMDLEQYSKYLGAKIYNASEISFIDAFERLKI